MRGDKVMTGLQPQSTGLHDGHRSTNPDILSPRSQSTASHNHNWTENGLTRGARAAHLKGCEADRAAVHNNTRGLD